MFLLNFLWKFQADPSDFHILNYLKLCDVDSDQTHDIYIQLVRNIKFCKDPTFWFHVEEYFPKGLAGFLISHRAGRILSKTIQH